MASLLVTVGAPLVIAPIQRLIGMATDATIAAVLEEIRLIRGVKQDKEKLVSTLQKINMVLAERNLQAEHGLVGSWLDELSEVVYDAEDVLDEFATEAALLSRRKKYSPIKLVRKLLSKHDLSHQLKLIWNKLDDIARNNLGIQMVVDISNPVHTPQNSSVYPPRQPTTGFIPFKEFLVPRGEETEKIMNWLFHTDDDDDINVSFFSIFGMGGLGKTTLAQSVYSNDKVIKEFFQIKMWVCVSNDFDILRITKDMLAFLDSGGAGGYHNVGNLDALQQRVHDKIVGKKFLLVLDDVWKLNDNWRILINPLKFGNKGSKVLVTTRDREIATKMIDGGQNRLELKGLSQEDTLSVLKNNAFASRNSTGGVMESICEEISKKLGGSPLAAKTVGRLLNSNFDLQYWKSIVTIDIGRLQKQGENDIMPILRISYERLPPHLKECFAYCSLFPKDYKIKRDELIQLWMAQGLIKPGDDQIQTLEYWGSKHFDDLLSLSLFEKYNVKDDFEKDAYVMHDLIHDLAVSVSEKHCVTLEGSKGRIFENIRHLSWLVDNITELRSNFGNILHKNQRLRSLGLECRRNEGWLWSIVNLGSDQDRQSPIINLDSFIDKDVFKKLKRLRVLRLRSCPIKRLPASINNLKHLRYLYLYDMAIQELPESLCDLCNLQVLNISDCGNFMKLPEGVGNLTNLRHLKIGGTEKLKGLPESLGKLINLRCLDLSSTSIEELPEDVSKLCNLEDINLSYCGNLKKLPDRVGDLTNLRYLDVSVCKNLKELPESLGNAHNLTLVHVDSYGGDKLLHKIAHPGGMTSLQELCTGAHPRELKHMNELRRLRLGSLHLLTSKEEASEAELHRKTQLTSLELCFDYIYSDSRPHSPNDPDHGEPDHHHKHIINHDEDVLEGLQPHLASIQTLTIKGYRGVRWPRWIVDPSIHQGFLSLEELEFSNMHNWEEECWWREIANRHGDQQQHLQQQQHQWRQPRPIIFFPCLRTLGFFNCPMLRRLPPLPPVLRELIIKDCPKVEWASSSSSSSLMEGKLPCGGRPLLSSYSSSLVTLTVGVPFYVRVPFSRRVDAAAAAAAAAQVVSQLLACLQELPSLQSLTIKATEWMSVSSTNNATTTGMLLSHPPWVELLQPLTSLQRLVISDCPLLTPFPRLKAEFSDREPAAKTAEDYIPCSNASAATTTASSSSSSSLPSSSLSVIPYSSSSSWHPQQKQIQLKNLTFVGIPPQMINWLLGGMVVPFLLPHSLQFFNCNELRSFISGDCEEVDELDSNSTNSTGTESVDEALLLALAPSLSCLHFIYCRELRRLPPKLSCLFSLKTLEIHWCDKIESLPEAGLPPVLQRLEIFGCSQELLERCREEAGADWPKISHIPERRIITK